jgi:hypothetical protein
VSVQHPQGRLRRALARALQERFRSCWDGGATHRSIDARRRLAQVDLLTGAKQSAMIIVMGDRIGEVISRMSCRHGLAPLSFGPVDHRYLGPYAVHAHKCKNRNETELMPTGSSTRSTARNGNRLILLRNDGFIRASAIGRVFAFPPRMPLALGESVTSLRRR